jgi:hypothetical protein
MRHGLQYASCFRIIQDMQTINDEPDYRLRKVLPKILGFVIGVSFWASPFTTLIWVFAGLIILVLGFVVLVVCLSPLHVNNSAKYYSNDSELCTEEISRKRERAAIYEWEDDPFAQISMVGDSCLYSNCHSAQSSEFGSIHSYDWD